MAPHRYIRYGSQVLFGLPAGRDLPDGKDRPEPAHAAARGLGDDAARRGDRPAAVGAVSTGACTPSNPC